MYSGIAAFGGVHVEIVTKITRNKKLDDEFCSRGAGRGSSDFGTERCESNFNPFIRSREINMIASGFLKCKYGQ